MEWDRPYSAMCLRVMIRNLRDVGDPLLCRIPNDRRDRHRVQMINPMANAKWKDRYEQHDLRLVDAHFVYPFFGIRGDMTMT